MAQSKKTRPSKRPGAGPDRFRHPVAGASTVVPEYLAIFWREDADRDTREAILEEYGLAPASIDRDKQGAMLRVNQTDRLSWVAAGGRAISDDTVAKLGTLGGIEWVSPAFRGENAEAGETGLFAVNPTRLYVRRQALDAAGGVASLDATLIVDESRSATLSGLVVLNVPDAKAIDAAAAIARTLSGGETVRFETIPFVSPAL